MCKLHASGRRLSQSLMNVRVWHLSDLPTERVKVRSSGKSGNAKCSVRLPYVTRRGRAANCHSITSSARPRMDWGTVRPTALAVLRLMASSTFVDCWTGRSPGFAPLRIFPV